MATVLPTSACGGVIHLDNSQEFCTARLNEQNAKTVALFCLTLDVITIPGGGGRNFCGFVAEEVSQDDLLKKNKSKEFENKRIAWMDGQGEQRKVYLSEKVKATLQLTKLAATCMYIKKHDQNGNLSYFVGVGSNNKPPELVVSYVDEAGYKLLGFPFQLGLEPKPQKKKADGCTIM